MIRQLAVGGMAEIYLARAEGLRGFEKTVVIKRILPEYASRREFVAMFLNEARVAMTLQHPNVVQTYDVGEVEGSYFMVMEYLHGENLGIVMQAVLRRKERLQLEHALNVMISVCSGLHYAHEHLDSDGRPLGLIHRDVTPQNIIVTYEGGVKLIDFGVAKAASRSSQTRCGTLKGKIAYMSPEQCVSGALDRRSDIFSLGIVLHEITLARRLFSSSSDFETLKKIVELPIPTPRRLDPAYPPALEAVVMRALQKNPEERYQTAREMQIDLEAFAQESRLYISPISLQTLIGGLFDGKQRERMRFGDQPARELPAAGEPSLAGLPREWLEVDLEPSGPLTVSGGRAAAAEPSAEAISVLSDLEAAPSAPSHAEQSLEIEIIPTPRPRRGRRVLIGLLAFATLCSGAAFALHQLYPGRVAAWLARFAPARHIEAVAGPPAPTGGPPAPTGGPPAPTGGRAAEAAGAASTQPGAAAAALAAGGAGTGAAGATGTTTAASQPASGRADPAVPAREPSEVGILQVVTRPAGARLFLEGKELSQRSPATVGGIPTGQEHALFVQLPGYRDTMVRAVVRAGKVTPLVIRLHRARGAAARDRSPPGEAASDADPPSPATPARRPPTEPQGDGTLVIASSPWCNVTVDGVDKGPTPLTLKLPAGKHTVALSNTEFRIRRTLSIHVTAGQTIRKHLEFGVE